MKPAPASSVLLVGQRGPAVKAAKRLGLVPLVLDLKEVEARAGPRRLPVPPEPEAVAEGARRLARGHPPCAVIPLTEEAVVLAPVARQALGVPGPDATQSAPWNDKALMKQAVRAAGLPCTDWRLVEEHTTPDELRRELGLPLVLKPLASSGGRGMRVVRSDQELAAELVPGELAETFVEGLEMSLETLLQDGEVLFQNSTRYLMPRWANVVPSGIERHHLIAVERLARDAHRALGVARGMTHMEVFLTPSGPVFGEMAARPPGGELMRLLELAYGFDPWEAFLRIWVGERPELPVRAARAAGVWFLHPGEGSVLRVEGVRKARALPGVEEVRCRLRPGDRVEERLGVGEQTGRLVAVGADPEACATRLRTAREQVRIVMARPAGPGVTPMGDTGPEAPVLPRA